MTTAIPWAAAVFVIALTSCSGQHSPAGFRLPENGDVDRGRVAFVDLKCHTCHRVVGEDLPAPAVEPAMPIALGGTVYEIRTDGYLVTSMINPSHKLAGYPKDRVSTDGESKMPDVTRGMTVRQLVDIVAFLRARYKVVPLPNAHP